MKTEQSVKDNFNNLWWYYSGKDDIQVNANADGEDYEDHEIIYI